MEILPLHFSVQYCATDLGQSRINLAMPEESYPGSHPDRMEFEGIPSDNALRLTSQI